MGQDKKKAYLKKVWTRYNKASRKLKAQILEEFCAVCDYHRKHAIRLLNQPIDQRKKAARQSGRKPIYQSEAILNPLRIIWFATDQMCSKKLKAAIPLWLPFYEQEYGILDHEIKEKLETISSSTIDRSLKPIKAKSEKRKTKEKGCAEPNQAHYSKTKFLLRQIIEMLKDLGFLKQILLLIVVTHFKEILYGVSP